MTFGLILALFAPLVFLVPPRQKVWFTLGLVGAGSAAALAQAVRCLAGAATTQWDFSTVMGPGQAAMDPLSALFTLVICIGAVAVTLYSKGYLEGYLTTRPRHHISLHYMALALLFLSMLGVVTVRDGYGFLVCWELMTICSFVLILFDAQKKETRRAALNYLIMMHVGFVFLLAGFVTLGAKGLPVDFGSLAAYFAGNAPIPLFLLFLVGFGMKAGLFPLHTWLPEAHPAAPAHVSAFMSGVMIKMGVYGVLRVAMYMETGLLTAGIILFTAGIVTGVWGVLFAAVQNDVKRLLAYSSIENIGIIFMAVGAALIGRSQDLTVLTLCAMSGALLHTVNHSMFKTLLFFGAGNIYTATHTTSIEALGGLAKRMPVTALLFAVATVAICALPPLSGFVSEFMIYYGFFGTLGAGGGGIVMAVCGIVALSFIGGVVVMAFSKLYGVVFSGTPRTEHAAHAAETDIWRHIGSAIPVAGIVLVGLLPFLFMRGTFGVAGSVAGIGNGTELYSMFVSGDIYRMALALLLFIALTAGIYTWKTRRIARRPQAVSPTWGCGYGAPAANMQYTGESFTEGLESIAPHLSGTTSGGAVQESEIFPDEHTFRVRRDDRVATLFNAWWIELLRGINSRVMRMRTGKVNYYILYALVFLLLVLLLSIFGVI